MIRVQWMIILLGATCSHGASDCDAQPVPKHESSILQVDHAHAHRKQRISSVVLKKMVDQLFAQVKGKTWSEVTPEVQQKFNQMIEIIKNEILTEIIADYDAAQKNYDVHMDQFETETREAFDAHNASWRADETLYDCRHDELHLLEETERLQRGVAGFCDTVPQVCDFPSKYKWHLPSKHFGYKECYIRDAHQSLAHNCHEWSELLAAKHQISLDIKNAAVHYIGKREVCRTEIDMLIDKERKLSRYRAAFLNQRKHCNCHEQATALSICTFAQELHEKCESQETCIDIRTRLNTTAGDNYSEFDRIKEWGAVVEIMCTIKSYSNHTLMFDEQVLKDCLDDYPYPETFDYQNDRFYKLVNKANTSCSAKHHFFALRWQMVECQGEYAVSGHYDTVYSPHNHSLATLCPVNDNTGELITGGCVANLRHENQCELPVACDICWRNISFLIPKDYHPLDTSRAIDQCEDQDMTRDCSSPAPQFEYEQH